MIIYIEDILREADILNWYRGEAAKQKEPEAVAAQSNKETQDAMLYHLRLAVMTVLNMANRNRVRFTCDDVDDGLVFSIAPIREGREYVLPVLKENIRLFLVAEIRRLWMMNVRPEWADATMREKLLADIGQAMNDVTAMGPKVRRRCAIMGI